MFVCCQCECRWCAARISVGGVELENLAESLSKRVLVLNSRMTLQVLRPAKSQNAYLDGPPAHLLCISHVGSSMYARMPPGVNPDAGFELLENRMATSQPWLRCGRSLARKAWATWRQGNATISNWKSTTLHILESMVLQSTGVSSGVFPPRS